VTKRENKVEPVQPPQQEKITLREEVQVKKTPPRKENRKNLKMALILLSSFVAIAVFSRFLPMWILNPVPMATITKTSYPTDTSTPQATNTPIATSTPELEIGSSWTRPEDGMVMMYVPAGEFQMGSEDGQDDEKPVHTVYLDAFWIDQTEVTNNMYSQCVQNGFCESPDGSNFRDSQYTDHPVVYISWENAKTYCEWANARLPTEAEWEKAARGMDGRTYPWGEEIDCNMANYSSCAGTSTTEVASYENGKSIYGIYDMVGNVWEWGADWYDEDYYANSPASNPTGPKSGSFRVVRGGAWYDYDNYVRSASRSCDSPSNIYDFYGFRCARSATP